MARARITSLRTCRQGIQLILLSAVFVLAQIMVGYHHVGEEYGHAHSHDHDHVHPLAHTVASAFAHIHGHEHEGEHPDLSTACDICTIAATVSGSRDVSFIPDAPTLRAIELPVDAVHVVAAAVAAKIRPTSPG